MTKQLFAVKGKMTMADVLAKIARENLRIEQNAAKPPTIAQDTSIMDDLAEIVALGDGLCEPPRRGPAGHWTERSFMDANREPFPEVPEPEIKEPFEDESTNHGF